MNEHQLANLAVCTTYINVLTFAPIMTIYKALVSRRQKAHHLSVK